MLERIKMNNPKWKTQKKIYTHAREIIRMFHDDEIEIVTENGIPAIAISDKNHLEVWVGYAITLAGIYYGVSEIDIAKYFLPNVRKERPTRSQFSVVEITLLNDEYSILNDEYPT